MKDEPRTPLRHQLDHAVPTVIHHPEEDMPVLARWLDRAMRDRGRFWGLVGGLVVVVIGLAVLVNGLELGQAASDEAWTRLELAKSASERVELAREYPNTHAERWALLQAANDYYYQGFVDLPANRDAALPVLKKALDLYDRVARESPADSALTRVAALGLAQTLEARGEVDKAVAQYDRVASTWKGSDEARQAEAKAQELKRPGSKEFYQKLYAYKAPEVTLPPRGQGALDIPGLGGPSLGGPSLGGPSSLPPPPPSSSPSPISPAMPAPEIIPPLPPSTTAPAPAPAPKPEAVAPSGDLPGDVFAPAPAPAPKEEAPAKSQGREADFPDDPLAPPESKPSAPGR